MILKRYKKLFLILIFGFVLFLTSCSCSGSNAPQTKFQDTDTDKNLVEWVNQELNITEEDRNNNADLDELTIKKNKAIALIQNYAIYENIAVKEKYQYVVDIIKNTDIPQYEELINLSVKAENIDTSVESKWVKAATFIKSCTSASNSDSTKLIKEIENYSSDKEINVNEVVCAFTLKVNERISDKEVARPLKFYTGKDFWGNFFDNIFVFPIAWLIIQISKLSFGFYAIGLLIVTLLVRTIAWPIYAKTNDMSLKMQLMQPELNKINEKYANKQDDRSKQMMQMEMAQLYKKYKVGLGGCLMPFIQFPIFMAIYRAVSRIPYTVSYSNTIYQADWANEVNPNFFGINLFEDRTTGTGQMIGVIILMIIVVGTQFLSQYLIQRRQRKNQEASQADIPAYKRQAMEQSKNSAQGSMKIMMYMMMLMMGLFVFTSKAGLGLYWCIGNIYSMVQSEINHKKSGKRLEELKKKY